MSNRTNNSTRYQQRLNEYKKLPKEQLVKMFKEKYVEYQKLKHEQMKRAFMQKFEENQKITQSNQQAKKRIEKEKFCVLKKRIEWAKKIFDPQKVKTIKDLKKRVALVCNDKIDLVAKLFDVNTYRKVLLVNSQVNLIKIFSFLNKEYPGKTEKLKELARLCYLSDHIQKIFSKKIQEKNKSSGDSEEGISIMGGKFKFGGSFIAQKRYLSKEDFPSPALKSKKTKMPGLKGYRAINKEVLNNADNITTEGTIYFTGNQILTDKNVYVRKKKQQENKAEKQLESKKESLEQIVKSANKALDYDSIKTISALKRIVDKVIFKSEHKEKLIKECEPKLYFIILKLVDSCNKETELERIQELAKKVLTKENYSSIFQN